MDRGSGAVRSHPPTFPAYFEIAMNPEILTYSQYIRKQIADVHAALKGLSEEQLNRRPDVPRANSGYVIATHVLGNARAWVLGIVCGQPLARDRPGEFASSGTYEQLGKAACALSGEIDAALAAVDQSTLDDRFVPAQELWGEGKPHEISPRGALGAVLEDGSVRLRAVRQNPGLVRGSRGP